MRILLTGGCGFLGSHLAERLVLDGDHVDVLDDMSTGSLDNLAGLAVRARVVRASVLDRRAVERAVSRVDRVVHLAAPVGVDRVAAAPDRTWDAIVLGTSRVLDAVARRGVPAVVLSSSEVYGFAPPSPVREEDVPASPDTIEGTAPRLAYARGKLVADRDARARAAAGQAVLVVRPFNVVGARQRVDGGAVLPRFVACARAGRPIPLYFGGRQRRTFIEVRDFAAVIAALARYERWPVDAVNVGGEEEWTMAALAERVNERLGANVRIEPSEAPPSRGGVEIARRVPSLRRLRRLVPGRPLRTIDHAIDALAGRSSGAGSIRIGATTAAASR